MITTEELIGHVLLCTRDSLIRNSDRGIRIDQTDIFGFYWSFNRIENEKIPRSTGGKQQSRRDRAKRFDPHDIPPLIRPSRASHSKRLRLTNVVNALRCYPSDYREIAIINPAR